MHCCSYKLNDSKNKTIKVENCLVGVKLPGKILTTLYLALFRRMKSNTEQGGAIYSELAAHINLEFVNR